MTFKHQDRYILCWVSPAVRAWQNKTDWHWQLPVLVNTVKKASCLNPKSDRWGIAGPNRLLDTGQSILSFFERCSIWSSCPKTLWNKQLSNSISQHSAHKSLHRQICYKAEKHVFKSNYRLLIETNLLAVLNLTCSELLFISYSFNQGTWNLAFVQPSEQVQTLKCLFLKRDNGDTQSYGSSSSCRIKGLKCIKHTNFDIWP